MEDKFKFVVRGRKEGDKFILEGITNFIMKSLESYDGKIIIVTFEMPVTTNGKKMDNCILINWISNIFWIVRYTNSWEVYCI